MERHKIGPHGGTLKPICDVLNIKIDPNSSPVVYSQIGQDLNGTPIEAGFGTTTWKWTVMSQADYDLLLELQGDVPGAPLDIYTQKRSGASGIEFGKYQTIAKRPVFDNRDGLICNNVSMEFIALVAI